MKKFDDLIARHFSLENGNLEFNLESDNLDERCHKPDSNVGNWKRHYIPDYTW